METALAIISFILIFFLVIYYISSKIQKSIADSWEIGDLIIINNLECTIGIARKMNEEKKEYANLVGWSSSKVFLEVGDTIFCESRKAISCNKSLLWREHYNDCEKYMNKKPKFNAKVSNSNNSNEPSGELIDGEPIETLSEIKCEIFLKKAILEENYELAKKIRQRMEKFR